MKIKFVKEQRYFGITRQWFVMGTDEFGKVGRFYPKDKLPKYAQKFINNKSTELFSNYFEEEGFTEYIYR